MDVVSLCALPVGMLRWQSTRRHISLIVKGTFSLDADGDARLLELQEPLCLDRASAHELDGLVHASDFAPRKAKCDVSLVGHAHIAPPANAIECFLGVDEMRLRFTASAPEAVSKIRLSRVGPRAPGSPDRASPELLGASWDEEHPPPLPESFDFEFFNVAPPHQRVAALATSARLTLQNLLEGAPRRQVQLPGVRPRAFALAADAVLHRQDWGHRPPRELRMICDTVWIHTDRQLFTLTWRGVVDLEPDEAEPAGVVIGLRTPFDDAEWSEIRGRLDDAIISSPIQPGDLTHSAESVPPSSIDPPTGQDSSKGADEETVHVLTLSELEEVAEDEETTAERSPDEPETLEYDGRAQGGGDTVALTGDVLAPPTPAEVEGTVSLQGIVPAHVMPFAPPGRARTTQKSATLDRPAGPDAPLPPLVRQDTASFVGPPPSGDPLPFGAVAEVEEPTPEGTLALGEGVPIAEAIPFPSTRRATDARTPPRTDALPFRAERRTEPPPRGFAPQPNVPPPPIVPPRAATPPRATPEPEEKLLPLALYAEIRARLREGEPLDAVLEEKAIDASEWHRNHRLQTEALEAEARAGKCTISLALFEAMSSAQKRVSKPEREDRDIDEYVELLLAVEAALNPIEALESYRLTTGQWQAEQDRWNERCQRDAALAETLREKIGAARRLRPAEENVPGGPDVDRADDAPEAEVS